MLPLSLGQVSGIIQALITALQLFFPTALALLLVGVLKDDMSAVSWSSVGATLHSSYWAPILRADTSVSTNVHLPVRWLLRLASITMLLTSLASIITPLGLFDAIEPNETLQDVSFPYLADSGPLGYGTPPRDKLGFNRQCGIPSFAACPGSNTVEVKPEGDYMSSDFPFGYDSRIPQEKIDLFQSGLEEQMQTVSSFFDIQYRVVNKQQDPDVNNGTLYNVGSFRQVDTLVLNDAVEAVEGLIVNTADKGIAFRNHTLPSGIPLGATWEEDLLVMEPVSQCVDTNLTIDFTMSGLNGTFVGGAKSPVLTDRGGFVNIAQEFPAFDTSAPQVDPDLYGRAYLGAWAFNVYTAIYLNVTRPKPDRFGYLKSEIGKTFFMPESSLLHIDELSIGPYADLFSLIQYTNDTFLEDNSTAPVPYPNPFDISNSNFSDVADACVGSNLANSNMSSVAVGCGLVYGAPRTENGKTALFYDPGTKLSMAIYSCASAVKVSIKTFSLRYNGTEGLKSLHVDSIEDYSGSSLHWGIENNNARKDLDIDSAPPIWGLVSSDAQPSKELDVITSPHLYLPGVTGAFSGLSSIGTDNMPGLDFPTDALSTIYRGDLGDSTVGTGDYSGKTSFAMFTKWQQLMSSANGVAKIIDLIYTDLSANGLVGTKSWLKESNDIPGGEDSTTANGNNKIKRQSTTTSAGAAQATARVPVRIYNHRIKYNYLFGIPAYFSLLVSVLVGTLTLLYLLSGRTSLSKTRKYLNVTSPGRIITSFVYAGESEPQVSTSRWKAGTGARKVRMGERTGWRPVAVERVQFPEKLNGHGPVMYTGAGAEPMHGSTSCSPGYANDTVPLIAGEGKPVIGASIQMTPLQSYASPVPTQGGLQQQQYMPQQGYQYGQQSGAYPPGGFAR